MPALLSLPLRHPDLVRAIADGRTLQITDADGNPKPDFVELQGLCALQQLVTAPPGTHFRVKPEDSRDRYFAFLDTATIVPIPGAATFEEAGELSPSNTHWILDEDNMRLLLRSGYDALTAA
jgi:hypothetical protein